MRLEGGEAMSSERAYVIPGSGAGAARPLRAPNLHETAGAVNDAQAAKKKGTKTEKAAATGKALAELLKKNGIANAVFDVGGFKYHGRVKAIAEGLRDGGIKI